SCFFFFQAEDGIRDSSVTGVQTCALPICDARWSAWQRHVDPFAFERLADLTLANDALTFVERLLQVVLDGVGRAAHDAALVRAEIGRASCRESVWLTWDAEACR